MSTTPEMEQLTARLDELQRRTAGLTAALAGSRNSRRMIMLAFVAFVFVALMGFYSLANRIQSAEYQQRLVAELQKSVASNQDTFASECRSSWKVQRPSFKRHFLIRPRKTCRCSCKSSTRKEQKWSIRSSSK